MSDLSVGVYFSANDAVYDWAIAFLNSFRKFNPTLRLLLIPFNDQCDRLLKLQPSYCFEIYEEPTFERLEAIGQSLELGHTPTGPQWFRRFASFWGPCDRFMYLDTRQLVLADLEPIITALDHYDFELLYFDCAIDQVYEPGELRRHLLRQGRARGFLSGLWAARKGLFTIEHFEYYAVKAQQVRQQLNPRNTDQALLNYCCDIKRIRYGSVAAVIGGVCEFAWARQSGKIYYDNQHYYLWDHGGLSHKKQLILLHWAGHRLSPVMPHYTLFETYRNLRRNHRRRFFEIVRVFLQFLSDSVIQTVRGNLLVNRTYNHIKQKINRNG
jgi:hypothetical protein